jgi:hypothetical protein
MQKSYSNNKSLYALLFVPIILLLCSSSVSAAISSCPEGFLGVAIGAQNSHLFRNDINIGVYDALASEFRAGTDTNITFTLQARDEIVSFQAFPIGNITLSTQLNYTSSRITMRIPQESYGSHIIIVYAEIRHNGANGAVCRTILSYPVTAYYRPLIIEVLPSDNMTISENEIARISLRVQDKDTDASALTYRWFKNGESYDSNSSLFEWITDYESEGDYELLARVTDDKGLYVQKSINLTVLNVNRPPVMRYPISDIVMREDENQKNIDLQVFFIDPDKDILTYEYDITYFEESMNRSSIEDLVEMRMRDQTFMIKRLNPVEARIGAIITATDPYGAYARSNVFVIDILDFNVSTRTLRATAECPLKTECTDWGFCTADAIQTRQCTDTDCHGNQDFYLQKQSCKPEATCYDGIKNCPFGICEEDIDCGGPCEPCRECDHPSCMAIFCPGGCSDGHMCNTNRQCKSLNCHDFECQAATCFDGIRNQGEEGVDCGGPCEPCPTCFDGIQNQGEEGVDCGGPCDRECITLSYIIRNYWGIIPIILSFLILFIIHRMMNNTVVLTRLVRTFRLGSKYNDNREKLIFMKKKLAYAVENPYGNNGASRATYEGLLEELASLLLGKPFFISEQSLSLLKKEKCNYITKKILMNLIERARAQESSLFTVAYPMMIRELRDIANSYARALAYGKATTHL